MQCKKCGSSLRRVPRNGFMQKKVYTLFGFYPWECPVCRTTTMHKKQLQRRRRGQEQTSSE